MGTFTAVAGLDEIVAVMVAPEVRQVADRVRTVARRLAPEAKSWINQGDERVRPTHVAAPIDPMNHNAPDNLRFKIISMDWDMFDEESNHNGPHTWMLHPHDWSSGAVANILECRCRADHDKDAIRNTITTGPTQLAGPVIRITVSAYGNRVVASEFGESYDHIAPPAPGLRWMGTAAATVAAAMG